MRRCFAAILIALFFLSMLTSCGTGSTGAKEETGKAGETFYLQRIIFYDKNQNFSGFYNAPNIGSEDSELLLADDGTVRLTFFYQGEKDYEKKGSVSEDSSDDEQKLVLFEGDGVQYYLTRSEEEDGTETLLLLYLYDDAHYAGMIFGEEKEEPYDGQYDMIILSDKTPFDETDTYQDLQNKFGENFDIEYDAAKAVYYLRYQLPSGTVDALISKNPEAVDVYGRLIDALIKMSDDCYMVVTVAGYREVTCRVEVYSDKDASHLLFAAENGKEVVKEEFGGSSSGSGQSSQSGQSGGPSQQSGGSSQQSGGSSSADSGGLEDSKAYKEIKRICLSSFSDNNPKLKYDKSGNTLTLTLEAPKGTHAGVDAKDMNTLIAWYGYTASLADVSYAGYELLCDDGFSHIAFIIMVSSDRDSTICLYATMNGVDYYNFADE